MENKVLATVEGKDITAQDVEIFLQQLGQQRAAQFNNEEGKSQILNELVNQKLLLADAIDNKVEETEVFKQELARLKETVLTQININNLLLTAQVSDDELQAHFEANKAKYAKAEEVSASHILVDTEEACQEIYNKIKNEDLDFATAAKENSSCPSKDQGGSLGSFSRGRMVPEFEEAAFNMEIGEISEPIKTQFGYHIIKLDDKTPAQDVELSQVKQTISNELMTMKQREVYVAKVEELKNKYKVDYK
ncbi:peptidylprolyl isomerase [bacterium]|nr:peptidylprolyl isomerase [bacterium]